ncbi:MAG: aminopeptidase P family protein [Actinobacteria bacterium]|nr:aminopeptidase P family protein [Actinomycetota bacterium]
MNPGRRLGLLRKRLADSGIPAIVVTDVVNIRYITGFKGVFDDHANVACLVTESIAQAFTDSRYTEAAVEAAVGTDWSVRAVDQSLYVELCDVLAGSGVGSLALESSMPYGRFRFISECFDGNVEMIDQWIEEQRQVKEPEELDRIQQAAKLTDRAFEHILTRLGVGVTEREIAWEIEAFMRSEGADGLAFPPIVASGLNSSRPHAIASEKVLELGDLVTIDLGAKVDGYCADMTRTVVIGKASEQQRELHAVVLEAHAAGLQALRGGLRGQDIDAKAREVIESAGFAGRFGHGLGHGVGLEVHELPTVSPRGRAAVLTGSVVTVEPGIYIPGLGGVRIEDLAVVESEGYTLLSGSPRELLEL